MSVPELDKRARKLFRDAKTQIGHGHIQEAVQLGQEIVSCIKALNKQFDRKLARGDSEEAERTERLSALRCTELMELKMVIAEHEGDLREAKRLRGAILDLAIKIFAPYEVAPGFLEMDWAQKAREAMKEMN